MRWPRKYCLETLLGLATLSLVAQLACPGVVMWANRPRPGKLSQQTMVTPQQAAWDYLVYLPKSASRSPLPLVIFLHGSGEREADTVRLRKVPPLSLAEESNYPFVLIAPHCPKGRSWEASLVMPLIEEAVSRYHVDPSRVYLTGFSMGAYGTWQIAGEYPGSFAAIVPIAGGGRPEQAVVLKEMPIWAVHGTQDDVVPPSESRTMVAALQAAGGKPLLTLSGRHGHGIDDWAYAELGIWSWMLNQRHEGRQMPR